MFHYTHFSICIQLQTHWSQITSCGRLHDNVIGSKRSDGGHWIENGVGSKVVGGDGVLLMGSKSMHRILSRYSPT
jgi:hypothetical protein